MAKKGQRQRKYSAEFKIGVIVDMREHHLGYKETAKKYDLCRNSMDGAICTLHRWERIYLKEGAENLFGRLKVEMFYGEKFQSVKAFVHELKAI